MVDIEDLKSSAGYSVRVRVPPWAQNNNYHLVSQGGNYYFAVMLESKPTAWLTGTRIETTELSLTTRGRK